MAFFRNCLFLAIGFGGSVIYFKPIEQALIKDIKEKEAK